MKKKSVKSAAQIKREREEKLIKMNAKTQTKRTQSSISSEEALTLLKHGNKRFVANRPLDRSLLTQVGDTSANGQFPFATVLSCIDSRVSSELIFDQGIGDIFSVRIAGNFINTDILGSMEFATKLAGTKIIVVLGHTSCGAVKGSVDDAQIGNLGAMVAKIRPAVNAVRSPKEAKKRTSKNIDFVNAVAAKNVKLSIQRILNESTVIAEMVEKGKVKIVGGMYDISTGKVKFYN